MLADAIGHLSTIDYIRNGGGTMWGHNGNREIGWYHYYVYRYVQMKLDGAATAPQAYDQLAEKLDARMAALKKQGAQGMDAFAEPEEIEKAAKDLEDEYAGLAADVQAFKKLTDEKDQACVLLLDRLTLRVADSVDSPRD
ncbi:hypothetical protein [Cohnella caldifontis]|uniref:hypothetical protein n=1 Tax=Cohnella caldifontis TaxID=3027471 RepID=UPI0023EB203A|nr:hypothetical protein [Cohnella sp. YIM B05605]